MWPILRNALAGILGTVVWTGLAWSANPPTVKQALTLEPLMKDVDYDVPGGAVAEQCKIAVERYPNKGSGWVVTHPNGQVLRRFADTNADDVVDQWRYYKNGVEVYRDLDTNFNKRVDQMRWFNTQGSRWGLDLNEDGTLDAWKVLSPEEATREAILALISGKERLLETLMVTAADLNSLGIKGETSEKILAATTLAGKKLPTLPSKAQWLQFDGSLPSVIPQEQIDSKADIFAHQNVMAVVDNEGKTILVQIGTLLKIGDAWKLTRIPQPLEGNEIQIADDSLFSPAIGPVQSVAGAATVDPKLQKLVEELQTLDKNSPRAEATRADWTRFNEKRAQMLQKIADASDTDDEREVWLKQMADGIASGVQTDTFDGGLKQLEKLEADVRRKSPRSPLVAYVIYRRLTAEYNLALQKAPPNKAGDVQSHWLETLEKFVTDFPEAEDTPEAMYQLASTSELGGNQKEARQWYRRLADTGTKHPAVLRAEGALRRHDSKGEKLTLQGHLMNGQEFDATKEQGKVLVVIYWATWCRPCIDDLPLLKALDEQYRDRGLKIVGVSLDNTKEDASTWLKQNNLSWPQLFEEGGMERNPLAIQYGVVSTPTMFVTDRDGVVAYTGSSGEDLKTILAELFRAPAPANK